MSERKLVTLVSFVLKGTSCQTRGIWDDKAEEKQERRREECGGKNNFTW